MKKILIFTLVALALCLEAQAQVNNIVLNAGVAYTNGAPTFRPGGKGSRIAIDTVTWIWYESLDNNTGNWIESGYRVQPISGCVAPAYTPNKHQSVLVINGCDSLYYYRAGAWRHINPGGVSGVAWGDITGDITNQIDLQTALSDKADAAHNHALSDVLQSGATSGQVPKWNGSAWVPATDDNTGTTYTAGTGIAISGGNVISNTGDLSNTNEIQTVSFNSATGNLSISGGNSASLDGRYLQSEVDGSVTNEIELPSQTGNSGKYLTTNGATPSWATVSGGITGSASAGQVAYWDGTSSIAGNSTFFYDVANNRLGVGTSSPTSSIHVQFDGSGILPSNNSGFLTKNSSAATSSVPQATPPITFSGTGWKTSTSSSAEVQYRIFGRQSTGSANPEGLLCFGVNNSGSWNDGIFTISSISGGSVGIGLGTGSLPTSKLQVNGTAAATLFYNNYGGTATTDYILHAQRSAGAFNAPVNSALGIKFTNRQTSGLWSEDYIVNKVIANDGTLVTSGYFFGAHSNQAAGATAVIPFAIVGDKIGVSSTSPTSQVDINGATGYSQLRLRTTYTPTSTADANGNTGDFSWDDNYIYIKTSAGWKRAALSTF